MKKYVWSGLIAATAWAVGAGAIAFAQTQPPRTPATGSATSSTQRAANQISVTGCLERAGSSTGATGTTGTAGSSSSAGFILQNATMGSSGSSSSPSGSSSSTPSTGATGTSGAHGTTYQLEGETSKLSPHVGHKVEITGAPEGASSSSSATTNPPSASASAGMHKLRVESVRMIASSCTP